MKGPECRANQGGANKSWRCFKYLAPSEEGLDILRAYVEGLLALAHHIVNLQSVVATLD